MRYSGASFWESLRSGETDIDAFTDGAAVIADWNLDPADHTLSLTYTPTPVPEPGTLALVGLAAAGLAGWRRRERRT